MTLWLNRQTRFRRAGCARRIVTGPLWRAEPALPLKRFLGLHRVYEIPWGTQG